MIKKEDGHVDYKKFKILIDVEVPKKNDKQYFYHAFF